MKRYTKLMVLLSVGMTSLDVHIYILYHPSFSLWLRYVSIIILSKSWARKKKTPINIFFHLLFLPSTFSVYFVFLLGFFIFPFFFVYILSFKLDYKQIAWGDEFILTRR